MDRNCPNFPTSFTFLAGDTVKIYSGTIQVNQVKQVNQVNHRIPRFFPKKNAKQLWEVESWIQYLKMQTKHSLYIAKHMDFLGEQFNF